MNILRRTFLLLFLTTAMYSGAQLNAVKTTFRDTLDGAFDMSRFLIEMNGFIPFPIVITEPALGNIGGGLALVFLKKRPPHTDSVRGKARVMRTQPDIYGAGGMYTGNESWAAFGYCSGTWIRWRTKYRLASGLANINLSFYRTPPGGEEREYEFNIRTIPVMGTLLKELKGTYWSAGIQYTFLQTTVKALTARSDFVRNKEFQSTVSMPGLVIDFDNRDNVFTPDKGFRLRAAAGLSNDLFGSDYDYSNLIVFGYAYHPLMNRLIGALRIEMQEIFGDAPFYMLPFINQRGLPIARYQGNIATMGELELRWDVFRRWSLVGFAGSGKAHDSWSGFDESEWISGAGAGFRYLAARAYRLRLGIDIARGPEQWAYYFVLGNAWLR